MMPPPQPGPPAPPPQPPMSLQQNVVAQAIQLLRSGAQLEFKVEIVAESLIEADLQAERQDRTAFLTAVTQFLQSTLPAMRDVPQLAPLVQGLLMFGIRGFRIGRDVEGLIESTMTQLAQTAKAMMSKPPPPDPKIELEKQKAAIEMQKSQADASTQQQKAAADVQAMQQKAQAEIQVMREKAQAEIEIAQQKAFADIQIARDKAQLTSQAAAQATVLRAVRPPVPEAQEPNEPSGVAEGAEPNEPPVAA